jgi:hypothetical protein
MLKRKAKEDLEDNQWLIMKIRVQILAKRSRKMISTNKCFISMILRRLNLDKDYSSMEI